MKIKIMKPFNLEEAKAGKPVCTRDGRKARLICTDLKNIKYTVVAAVYEFNLRYEEVMTYTSEGKFYKEESGHDLFMVEGEEPNCPFKPFDKVMVRQDDDWCWDCSLFSRYDPDDDWYNFVTLEGNRNHVCIPYNEETEHLIGTTDDAPEKYVIW